jgi:hypothetical protein
LENIRDLLNKLEDKEVINHNPFASVPNHRLREALDYLTECSAEITPDFEQQ